MHIVTTQKEATKDWHPNLLPLLLAQSQSSFPHFPVFLSSSAKSRWINLKRSTFFFSSTFSSISDLDGLGNCFDRIWHTGLLARLLTFILHAKIISWIGSFLSGMSIAVRVNDFFSSPYSNNEGYLTCPVFHLIPDPLLCRKYVSLLHFSPMVCH